MAVELCKVALWLESIDPGRPLSFLDHRILCGNSLIGTTPRLLKEGIPDDAFKPIEGDDKAVCSEYNRRNKDERKGQQLFVFEGALPWLKLGNMPQTFAHLDAMSDESLADIEAKAQRYAQLVGSADYESARLLADAWCAAFVWKKTKEFGDAITESVFRRIEANPHDITPWMKQEIQHLRDQYQFFHWHLAFPDVFRVPNEGESAENEQTGCSGGFDVVLGNPPWERLKIQEKEWFAPYRPDISNAPNAAKRRRMIADLSDHDPELLCAFRKALRKADGAAQFIRDGGRYPLCGRGDINTYAIFAELKRGLLAIRGRVGCIVPAGIATDDTTRFFFRDVTSTRSLVSLYAFDNKQRIFPAIKTSLRFCLLTLLRSDNRTGAAPDFVFYARSVNDLRDETRHFTLTADEIDLLNPNTRTCPIFRSKKDAELTKAIYRRVPVLIKQASRNQPEDNPWRVSFFTMFHMANDSGVFRTRADVEAAGAATTGNVGHGGAVGYLPLFEAKLMHHFDHRAVTYDSGKTRHTTFAEKQEPALSLPIPRYWVDQREAVSRIAGKWDREWLIGWQDVTDVNTMSRSVIAAIIPTAAVGHTMPLMLPAVLPISRAVLLPAAMSTFVFDYIARQKIGGTHLTYGYLMQLPFPTPDRFDSSEPWLRHRMVSSWLIDRVIELTYTTWHLSALARDCGFHGPPFLWAGGRRFLIRCELDAAYFHLYGIARDDVDYIMETFPIVKRKDEAKYGEYRTKLVILEIYDEMAEVMTTKEAAVTAGGQPTAYQTRLDPPPGPPADEQGNFLPLPEWLPGQPRPANWPRHIHAPRAVYDWAKEQGIDWRTLLEPLDEEAPAAAGPQPRPAAAVRVAAPALPGLEPVAADVESAETRREREKEFVLEAFEALRSGRSHDFVVADPELNAAFLERARRLGAESDDAVLNSTLLNLRKAAKQKADKTTKPYRLPAAVQPYVFVSEWAVRHLQRELLVEANREPALDEILCNPAYAGRFDEVARRLCDRFSPLEYRWAALGLRKQSRQTPDDAALDLRMGQQLLLDGFDPADLPELPGLYLIEAPGRSLYVHETDNLRDQVTRHIETAGKVLVPDWLLATAAPPAQLAYTVLTDADKLKEARIRKVAELQPWLNLIELPGAA